MVLELLEMLRLCLTFSLLMIVLYLQKLPINKLRKLLISSMRMEQRHDNRLTLQNLNYLLVRMLVSRFGLIFKEF